ncbi:hypothetical protein N7540_003375 [Penicillium herquei]|nr:hypothetical protein N7540_003375 [Penicillium herquei]
MHSTTSPALKDIDPKYHPYSMPNSYKISRFISLSEEDLLKGGKTTDAVRIPDIWGGGYLASLEFTHQIHCVCIAWKY